MKKFLLLTLVSLGFLAGSCQKVSVSPIAEKKVTQKEMVERLRKLAQAKLPEFDISKAEAVVKIFDADSVYWNPEKISTIEKALWKINEGDGMGRPDFSTPFGAIKANLPTKVCVRYGGGLGGPDDRRWLTVEVAEEYYPAPNTVCRWWVVEFVIYSQKIGPASETRSYPSSDLGYEVIPNETSLSLKDFTSPSGRKYSGAVEWDFIWNNGLYWDKSRNAIIPWQRPTKFTGDKKYSPQTWEAVFKTVGDEQLIYRYELTSSKRLNSQFYQITLKFIVGVRIGDKFYPLVESVTYQK